MDAYQRGNRDGLLSFANALDAQAEVYDTHADEYEVKLDAGPYAHSPMHRNVLIQDRLLAHKLREIADQARRASQALPLDPENEDE